MQSTLHKVYDGSFGVFPKGWARQLLPAASEQTPVTEQQQESQSARAGTMFYLNMLLDF